MNVLCALADVVATKIGIILLFHLVRAKCMRTNVVRALDDVMATKLSIILLFSFFFLPRTFLPEGVCLQFCMPF